MTHSPEAVDALIRWQFERDHRHLTCAVSVAGEAPAYIVATMPLWNGGRVAIERFDTPCDALHRHAAIVADLRNDGWTVSAYTDAATAPSARRTA